MRPEKSAMNSQDRHTPILEVENLVTRFHTLEGTVFAVNGVDLRLQRGETLGIVGESGCGKSVTMLSILQLIRRPPGEIVSGKAIFHGNDLLQMSEEKIGQVRGAQIGMIFQDPVTFLNPVLTVGLQIIEPLMVHKGMKKTESRERAVELLRLVKIPEPESRLDQYPHQLSGGMRQRAMIAMAMACNPEILVADEPTTALDVTIQAQLIRLVKQLRDEIGMSVIWITHDLGIIAGLAQRVIVMYAGYIIEEAPVAELYANPLHPYTKGLLGSLPRLNTLKRQRLSTIPGLPPLLLEEPVGCPFEPRCSFRFERCQKENPHIQEIGPEHRVACWRTS
jgi:oligopeptide transport system ATP-binding protein